MLELVELHPGNKARLLVSVLEKLEHRPLARHMLQHRQFNVNALPVLCQAIKILDARRLAKSVAKRANVSICNLSHEGSHDCVSQTYRLTRAEKKQRAARSRCNELLKEASTSSLSGSVVKILKSWVKNLGEKELEDLTTRWDLSTQLWKDAADALHISKHDLALPWFLEFVHGKPAPAGTRAHHCASAMSDKEGLSKLMALVPDVPYQFLRQKFDRETLSSDPLIKAKIAEEAESVDVLLWYWEELECADVDATIIERLKKGEIPSLGVGKLMERLMAISSKPVTNALMPVVERKLSDLRALLTPPVHVSGDSSASMDVAIKTSTIISSLLSVVMPGSNSLNFFSGFPLFAAHVPQTIGDVLEVSRCMKATGTTACAASLYPLLECKKKVNWVILCTDEEENESYRGMRFHEVLLQYKDKVNPKVGVVLVSFRNGQEVGPLEKQIVDACRMQPIVFRFNGDRPDLTKLEALFQTLALTNMSTMSHCVQHMQKLLMENQGSFREASKQFDANPKLTPSHIDTAGVPSQLDAEMTAENENLCGTMALTHLPMDALVSVLNHFDARDLRTITCTNKEMLKARQDRRLWPKLFDMDMPGKSRPLSKVQQLVAMGFNEDDAEAALKHRRVNGDVNRAAEWILGFRF